MQGDLQDPQWVAGELRRRGLVVFVAGDEVIGNSIELWARLGGGRTGDVITADMVNRGRLVEVMQREEAARGAQA